MARPRVNRISLGQTRHVLHPQLVLMLAGEDLLLGADEEHEDHQHRQTDGYDKSDPDCPVLC